MHIYIAFIYLAKKKLVLMISSRMLRKKLRKKTTEF